MFFGNLDEIVHYPLLGQNFDELAAEWLDTVKMGIPLHAAAFPPGVLLLAIFVFAPLVRILDFAQANELVRSVPFSGLVTIHIFVFLGFAFEVGGASTDCRLDRFGAVDRRVFGDRTDLCGLNLITLVQLFGMVPVEIDAIIHWEIEHRIIGNENLPYPFLFPHQISHFI